MVKHKFLYGFFLGVCRHLVPYMFGNNAEIIVSGGMTMPQVISPVERVARQGERIPLNRIM